MSAEKRWDEITGNFIIANYGSQEAIDNDDGSCYFKTHGNLLVYGGGGLKSDWGGHSNYHFNNIYAFVHGCMSTVKQREGYNDAFYNNTCVLVKDGPYASPDCSSTAAEIPIMHDNRVYSPSAYATVCGKLPSAWGHDHGTTTADVPAASVLLAEAARLLRTPLLP